MDGEIMRKIKPRNYVILAIIFIVTIAFVFVLRDQYEHHRRYEPKTNDRLNILYEIKEDDLKSYVVENRDIVLYMSHATKRDLIPFENELKNYIAKNEISREMIYLNLDQVSSNFYTTFEEKYFSDKLKSRKNIILEQANMVILEDGKITDILYETKQAINLSDVEKFLKNNGVVE